MTTLNVLSDDSLQSLKRDHERLRYEVRELRVMLRALRTELGDDCANSVATTGTIIPGRSGTTPGGPILCQRKRLNAATPRVFVDYGPEIPVYSWVTAASSDPAGETGGILWIFIEQDIHGIFWFTGQDCPA